MAFKSPDNTTKSLRSRPLLEKNVWREDKLEEGGGILFKASVAFDIRPSLLPVGTLQNGPPCNNIIPRNEIQFKFEIIFIFIFFTLNSPYIFINNLSPSQKIVSFPFMSPFIIINLRLYLDRYIYILSS